jgi:hypothetical protein
MPLEKAKWDDIDSSNKLLKTQLETTVGIAQADDEPPRTMPRTDARMEALTKRNEKIKGFVNANLRALAAQAGARDARSHPPAPHRLRRPHGAVREGRRRLSGENGAGNPLAIDVFVKEYLDSHAHHKKPAGGTGGGARGGASFGGHGGAATVDAARRAWSRRSVPGRHQRLFKATRKAAS